ncbi:MAG: hypothetical protein M0006_02405 [Magnetospirillum sp.]|nr:hypothetical protein [Magnetospirillum sp.]
MDGHLRALLAMVAEAKTRGRPEDGKWSAVFAGGELARMEADGAPPPWPPELADEPFLGWAQYGAELARRKPKPPQRDADWRPKQGCTHAARAVGVED